jgi:hypothetical protein
MNEQSQLRHDFINNGLRIEVLNKIISEKLEQSELIESEFTFDLKKFLVLHHSLLEQITKYN